MESELPRFEMFPGGLPGHGGNGPPGREYQELWFALAHLPWASIVLVPADHGGSAAEVATALADFGSRLRDTPVTAIVANRIDYASARALAELQPRLNPDVSARPWIPSVEIEARPVDLLEIPANGTQQAAPVQPMGRAIIAIQPVVDEPLGVAIARAADAAVLCVQLGKTRMAEARRTIELIGANRVIGAVLVR